MFRNFHSKQLEGLWRLPQAAVVVVSCLTCIFFTSLYPVNRAKVEIGWAHEGSFETLKYIDSMLENGSWGKQQTNDNNTTMQTTNGKWSKMHEMANLRPVSPTQVLVFDVDWHRRGRGRLYGRPFSRVVRLLCCSPRHMNGRIQGSRGCTGCCQA